MAEVAEQEAQEQSGEEEEYEDENGEQDGSGRGTALKAAAAVAAASAAAVATKKALAKRQSENGSSSEQEQERSGKPAKSGSNSKLMSGSLFRSVAEEGWDAARDALVPVAEDVASAAGTYLAEKAPDIVRDRIVPRFISSFNEASGKS